MSATFGHHTSGPRPNPRARIVRSLAEGAVIGTGAGVVYAVIIGAWGSVAAPSVSGFFGLALLAGLVAVPTGLVLGAGLGIVFGILLLKVRHLAWVEASVIAVFGGIVLAAAIAGSGGVSSGVLAWSGGPLLVGVPSAALHGYRLQRWIG